MKFHVGDKVEISATGETGTIQGGRLDGEYLMVWISTGGAKVVKSDTLSLIDDSYPHEEKLDDDDKS